MLGSPNRPIRDIFKFFCLRLLAHIFFLQFYIISCQPREYIKLIILHERRARLTDCRTRKKQLRDFPTAVKGILCTKLIYLRLKTTDFWATYANIRHYESFRRILNDLC